MKTYQLPSSRPQSQGAATSGHLSWQTVLTATVLLACAGVTVFASARVMVSSHELAALHAEQSAVQQQIRHLETEFAEVSSLERVRVYAQNNGLVKHFTLAGTLDETVSVAQRTQ